MSQPTTAHVSLVEFAGHLMKQCAACPTLFNAATPGDRCPGCTFPLAFDGAEWVTLVDISAATHARYPETHAFATIYAERPVTASITVVEEAHFGQSN